jgi:hypothetical protein
MNKLEKAIEEANDDVLYALERALDKIEELEESIEDYRSELFWIKDRDHGKY